VRGADHRAPRVGVTADAVKTAHLTDVVPGGNTCSPNEMSVALHTRSAAALPRAAHGVVSILLVSILPR
jgi:hypothetical protein